MEVELFAQQMHVMHRRLDELYRGANTSLQTKSELLPVAFKELGVVSEELQVAVEELQMQNQELIAAQESLEIERRRYQELFELAPNAYLVTDTAGTIQEANHAAAKLLKVSQRFLVGKPLIIFVNQEERHTFHFQLNQLQQMQEWVLNIHPRKGKPFDAALKVTKIYDWAGTIVGLRVCIREVASHKQVEAGLLAENGDNSSQDCLRQLDLPKHVYLKGEIIPLNPQCIWQVSKGIVKLSTIRENGEEVLVGLAGPLMPFGSDLTSLQTYQATALSTVELVSFSTTDLVTYPDLAQIFLTQINQRLRQTEALLAISGQRHVKDRLYQLLLLLKQEIGQPVEQGNRLSIRFTHQDFADSCSTTRVTITRLIGKLQEEGKIMLDSQNHIILIEQDF